MTVSINGVAQVGITKLSELEIDVDKDWTAKKIQNLHAPDTSNDAARDDTIDSKITTHKGDTSAHHSKFTTTEHDTTARHTLGSVVPHDALAGLTEKAHGSLTGVTSDQHHAKVHGDAEHSKSYIEGSEVPTHETDPTVDATLKGVTKAQVQDHTPKAHTLASHSTKAHSELTGVTASQHHAKTTSASEITSGVLPSINRLPALASGKIWAGNVSNRPTEEDKPGVPTKEFFVPCTRATSMEITGYYVVGYLTAVDEYGNVAFHVPHDFTSIIEAVVAVIPLATQAAANWDIKANYAALGEAKNIHEETDTTSTYNVTSAQIFEVDISGILSNLAADDYVGVFLQQKTAGHNVAILGVRFKYS